MSHNAATLLDLLRAGKLAQAETLAGTLTKREPHNAFGWKVLGTLMVRNDRHQAAVPILERAQRLAPHDTETLNNLARAYHGLDRLDEALALYRDILIAQPDFAEGWNNQGLVQQALEQLTDALSSYDRALDIQPDYAKAHNNRGNVLRDLDRFDDALACHDMAIALDPHYAEAHSNRGLDLQALERLDEALVCHAHALSIRSDVPEILVSAGTALYAKGCRTKALKAFDQALIRNPDCAEAHNQRGLVMWALGRDEDAQASLKAALAIKPNHVGALTHHGMLLQGLGQLDNALASLDAALAIRPQDAAALTNRGNVLMNQGRLEEAFLCYQRMLEVRPHLIAPAHNRLFCLNYQVNLTREQVFAEHQTFEQNQAAKIVRLPPVRAIKQDAERRLRLGLVSGDFRHHSVAFFLLPILEHLDRQQFEVFCYSTDDWRDEVTETFLGLADRWIETIGLTALALAERIRADGIDLLIDLSGHTAGNALLAFVAKPAPVQISWIGYPNTTGLSAMDYRLVDAVTDPTGEADAYHTERLIRLPHGFLCYRPWTSALELPVGSLPSLKAGYMTFGSFNNLAKLTEVTLDLWAAVLRALPAARLRLKSYTTTDSQSWNRLIAGFAARGIAPDRLDSLPRAPSYREHLAQYQDIDIALDTFPYHGTTTTCEALFMGVPVVTLAGNRHVSRVGASLLTRVGLPELIAHSEADYVRIAVELAADRTRLSSLRAGLRERLEQSPLCDEIGFTRTLETALREMWRLWCAGEKSRVFDISVPTDPLETSCDPIQDPPRLTSRQVKKTKIKQKKTKAKRQSGTREALGDHSLQQVAPSESPSIAETTLVLNLFKQERYARAEAAARRLTERYPQAMFGWKALGTAFIKSNQYDAALPMLMEAFRLSPCDAELIQNLGFGLFMLGRLHEAMDCFKRALEINSDYAITHNNLGIAYKALGQLDEAMACYDRALEIDPDNADAYCNRGAVLDQEGRLYEAVESYQKSLILQPCKARTQSDLGNTYKNLGLLDQAIDCCRQALNNQPNLVGAFNSLLFCLNYRADISCAMLFAEHQAFERCIADQVLPLPPLARNGRDPEQILRIGFVSGDFRFHAVAFFLLPIIEHLDRERFQVFCYSRTHQQDDVTKTFRKLADGWINCAGLPEQALAERIRADGIDLLFDLSGHTNHNTLLAFAAKPAPVQITWIGYPNTTGLSAMDYRLVDAITDPPGEADACHTERLIRLPHGFLCYRPWTSALELAVGSSPYLKTGRITFGSFNNLAKLTDTTLDLWIKVLHAVPDARLLLKSHNALDTQVWDRLTAYFNAHGIASERLETLPRAPSYLEHLEQYQGIDIALDSFPYHGTTTTCEALFMGVPVVTLMGDRHAARVGGSLLTHAGLPELIAYSEADYVRIAVELAADRTRLSALRTGLREQLERSPLRDEVGFTRTLEIALRQMWRMWCAGEAPRVFEVAAPDMLSADKKEHLTTLHVPVANANRAKNTSPAPDQPQACSSTPVEQDAVIALFNQERYPEAEVAALQLTERYPQDMFGWKTFGTILVKTSRYEAALSPLLEANRLEPGNAECINNLGNALQNLGRLDEALACFKRALERDPSYAMAYNNLGVVLSRLGRFDAAMTAFEQALAIDPQANDAQLNRALALTMLGQPEAALDAFDEALKLRPDSLDVLNKRGILLQQFGRLGEARASFDQALAIKPDAADILTNLGNLFSLQTCLDEALDCYQRAVISQPDLIEPWHNRLLHLNYQSNLSVDQLFAAHQAFEHQWANKTKPLSAPLNVDRNPQRRLRIGFVSGDFHRHSVAFFVLPILEQLDRRQFQVFCYSTSLGRDTLTQTFQRLADGWIESAGLGARELANRIRADKIDLLFDLSGHTDGNALLVFAAKPAPVQITWIGYPNTTGLSAIDYRLVDAVTDPPGAADALHSETLIRLPTGFLCYRPLTTTVAVAPLPCLKQHRITFGSFNHPAKLTPATLDLWAQILKAIPDAQLLLKSNRRGDDSIWERLLAHFATRGIVAERLELLPRAETSEEHLALYGRIDIALDTFPYHGTTTTCEALFMGVPVVTLAGDRHASRVGASLLTRVGLSELIAHSEADYVRIAVELAADQKRLSALRAGLRERLECSPLRDEIGFTRILEIALRQMWYIWCKDELPHVFGVQTPLIAEH